jgi:hypothetical protein
MGAVRMDLGTSPGIVAGTVDLDMTKRVRTVLPSLQHRRPDVFARTHETVSA